MVGTAGRGCCTSVEPGQGRRAGLGIQMILPEIGILAGPGRDRILAGPGRMGRSSVSR